MKLVIIESPYAARGGLTVDDHVAYAQRCMKDSLDRDEAPFASHLLYTQSGILNDGDSAQRARGIHAGFAWGNRADIHAFYTDLGWSRGMDAAMVRCKTLLLDFEIRSIGNSPSEKST